MDKKPTQEKTPKPSKEEIKKAREKKIRENEIIKK